MGFGALRNIIWPLSRTLASRVSTASPTLLPASFGGSAAFKQLQWLPLSNHFHSLTDTRYPKRCPSDKPRPKRASLRPPWPYAWVQHVPGEPIAPDRPNEGSVKRRNEKKCMRQHRAFILAERRKRKAQLQEAERKKNIKRVECKMAAVARERAWTVRLAELQRLEAEKEMAMA